MWTLSLLPSLITLWQQVTMQVHTVCNFNEMEQTFELEFTLELDWEKRACDSRYVRKGKDDDEDDGMEE